MDYNTLTLDNGLRVIHLQGDSQVVYCGYEINVGTRNELPGAEGLAHFASMSLSKAPPGGGPGTCSTVWRAWGAT